MNKCIGCSVLLVKRWQFKYCSNKCQSNYRHRLYIADWKIKSKNGEKIVITKNISGYLKRYLLEKYGGRCSRCGWNKKHPTTNVVPLEVEHIDGNAENNAEKNLTILCPNCHALTPHFRNLNKGRGRSWRMARYITKQKKL